MLGQLALWSAAWQDHLAAPRCGCAAAAGMAAAAAVMMRPSWLLFTPFAMAAWTAAGCAIGSGNSSSAAIVVRCARAWA